MTHAVRQRHPLNGIGANPLTVTLRYHCTCATNEVLSIAVVLDKNITEQQFVFTMKNLFQDVKFEVEQHLKPQSNPK